LGEVAELVVLLLYLTTMTLTLSQAKL